MMTDYWNNTDVEIESAWNDFDVLSRKVRESGSEENKALSRSLVLPSKMPLPWTGMGGIPFSKGSPFYAYACVCTLSNPYVGDAGMWSAGSPSVAEVFVNRIAKYGDLGFCGAFTEDESENTKILLTKSTFDFPNMLNLKPVSFPFSEIRTIAGTLMVYGVPIRKFDFGSIVAGATKLDARDLLIVGSTRELPSDKTGDRFLDMFFESRDETKLLETMHGQLSVSRSTKASSGKRSIPMRIALASMNAVFMKSKTIKTGVKEILSGMNDEDEAFFWNSVIASEEKIRATFSLDTFPRNESQKIQLLETSIEFGSENETPHHPMSNFLL